jgi:hypothetical protein
MVKVVNFQTQLKFVLPAAGADGWLSWLAERGYLVCDRVAAGYVSLELYSAEESDLYALYHPSIQGLDTEYLFVDIPTEAQARELITLAQQVIVMLSRASKQE